MIQEDLIRKYKYGYVHSCKLLREPFVKDLLKENQKLKEHLKAYETYFNRFFKINNKTYDGKIVLELLDKKETQQKEFIKYLENEIEQKTPNAKWKHYNEEWFCDYDVENPVCIEVQPTDKVLKEILQKYKTIIGDDK